MDTPTPKQKILQAVEHLPDNATLENAIERLCFLAKVEEGMRQSTAGEVVLHQDAVRQLLGCPSFGPVERLLMFKASSNSSQRIPLMQRG